MTNKSFVIYGERNSGTNYLETLLTGKSYHLHHHVAAFDINLINPSAIESEFKNLFGHKHFFGFHSDAIKKADNTIFIGIVRNPYDWIMALNKSLHHIPPVNHKIKNFLLNEWYSIHHDKKSKFYGKEKLNDRDFDTELRYKNIFAMRSKKLKYLYHTMPKIANNYDLIRYEDLCTDPWSIITEWSDRYHLSLNMPIMHPIKKEPYKIDSKIKKIIDNNLDWYIENKIGYSYESNRE